jgi:transcriptional regulator with XRE-family HTH domain
VKKMVYGQKIKYIMEKVRGGMTLTDLHKATGLSLSYLSEAINGKCNMSIKALEKVADALGVSSAYLLDDKAISLQQLVELNEVEVPSDIVEFFAQQKNLPYAVLAKQLGDQEIDPEFLRDLLESIKKMKSK